MARLNPLKTGKTLRLTLAPRQAEILQGTSQSPENGEDIATQGLQGLDQGSQGRLNPLKTGKTLRLAFMGVIADRKAILSQSPENGEDIATTGSKPYRLGVYVQGLNPLKTGKTSRPDKDHFSS